MNIKQKTNINIAKKIIAAVLIVFMTVSNFIFFNITAAAEEGPITISSINMPGSVRSGERLEVFVTVKNNTSYKINNIMISTRNSSSGAISLTTSEEVEINIEANSSVTVSFIFNVSGAENIYDIIFTVAYSGIEITSTRRISVISSPKQNEPQEPYFEVVNELHLNKVAIGNNIKISFRFANTGATATGVTIEITANPDKGVKQILTAESSNPKIVIGTMATGHSYNCYYEFSTTSVAEPILQEFTITVKADSGNVLSYPIYVMLEKNTDNNITKTPNINIFSTDLPEAVKIGDKFIIKAVLENTGTDAKNITAALTFPTGIDNYSPLEITIDSMKQGEKKEVAFEAFVTELAETKYNSFILNVKYNKTADNEVKYGHPIGLLVLEKEKKEEAVSNLKITAKIPASVKPGENFKVSVTVKNNGADEKNFFIKIEPPAGIANKSAFNFKIEELKSGESITKEATFAAKDEIAGKYCLFGVVLYKKQTGTTDIILADQYTGTNVANIELPKIIIDSVKFPQNVGVGDNLKIEVTVMNAGAADAENVKLAVTTNQAGILNTTADKITVDSIKKGKKETRTFTFKVEKGVKYGYNPFNFEVSYPVKSETGVESVNQYFGVTVISSNLRIESVRLPSSTGVNRDFSVEVTIKNTGADTTDVLLTLTQQGGLKYKSSNVAKIDVIKSGETVTRSFTFMAPANAPDGYASIDVALTHGDDAPITYYSGLNIINPPKKEEESKPEEKHDVPVVIISNSYITVDNDEPADNNGNNDFNDFNDYNDYDESYGDKNINSGGIDFGMPEVITPRGESDVFAKTSVIITPMPETSPARPGNSYKPDYSEDGSSGVYPDSSAAIPPPSSPVKDKNAVYGGKTFIFTIELLNTHRSVSVKDLKITISQEKGIFNPKSGSNTFFVEWLRPGETVEQSIELLVKSDADPDSYGITISLSYKSEYGETASSSEIINIPVQQELRFDIGDLPPINDVEMGDDAYVNVQFGNLGKSLIYNVVVKVQGEGFMNQQGTYYAGNIEKGKFLAYEFTLTPTNPGLINGTFIFTYEDADGISYNAQMPFFFNVIGDMEEYPSLEDGKDIIIGPDGLPVINPEDGENPDGENSGFWLFKIFKDMDIVKWAIIIGAGLLVIAIVIIIIVVVRKKSKKKKKEDMDDDAYDL